MSIKKHMRFLCMILLTVSVCVASFCSAYGNTEMLQLDAYVAEAAGAAGNIEQYYTKEVQEYACDFSNGTHGYRIAPRNAVDMSDGALRGRGRETFFVETTEMVGDIYGLQPTSFSFSLKLNDGSLSVVMRLPQKSEQIEDATEAKENGLCFTIREGSVTVTAAGSGLHEERTLPCDLREGCIFTVEDQRNVISLYVQPQNGGDKILVTKVWHSCFGTLNTIRVSTTEPVDVTSSYSGHEVTTLAPSGYAMLYAENFDGEIDDLYYAFVDLTYNAEGQEVDYTYWTATDDLGRTTPEYTQTGAVRKDKYVGIFYFLCHVGGWPIVDHTQLYLQRGLSGLKLFLETHEVFTYGDYWAEPYFGYYEDTDEWVLRKHAQMLCDAGVDFIFVDISNSETYKAAHSKLFEVWLRIREEGGNTPQICFLTGDKEGRILEHLKTMRSTVYSDENFEKYKELMFMWDGKPLIFGNPGKNLSAQDQALLDRFTVRGCWAWVDKDGYWNWITESPQYKGRNIEGVFEQMSVVMGHHPSTSKGRSYTSANGQPNNGLDDFEYSSRSAKYGYCFQEQFDYALSANPSVIMITGWNEWTAGRMSQEGSAPMANTKVYFYQYVDQFNPEFSRDGEPMKLRDGVGFGDNYYYQMIDYIRLFKGAEEPVKADARKTIDLSAGKEQWDDVLPRFTDTGADTAPRSHDAYDHLSRYVNNTGRNDIIAAKVAQDDENIYFMVQTAKDIIPGSGMNWMNLFLDLDCDAATGWEGFDYILNTSRTAHTVSVERFSTADWESRTLVGEAQYTVDGDTMMVKLPKALLKTDIQYLTFEFKWADNSTVSGDVMEFMDLGDSAPNSRFRFRFVGDTVYRTGPKINFPFLACFAVLSVTVCLLIIKNVRKGGHRSSARGSGEQR